MGYDLKSDHKNAVAIAEHSVGRAWDEGELGLMVVEDDSTLANLALCYLELRRVLLENTLAVPGSAE